MNSKKKGNRGELELVHILNERFKTNQFKRTPYSGMLAGKSNKNGIDDLSNEVKTAFTSDLICPPDFLFVIENKFYRNFDFWWLFNEKSELNDWLGQVEKDAEYVKKFPLLVVKINNHKTMVFVKKKPIEHIFRYREWYCLYLNDFLQEREEFFYGL